MQVIRNGLLVLLVLGAPGCGGSSAKQAIGREEAAQAYIDGMAALESKDYATAQQQLTVAIDTGFLNIDRYVNASTKRAIAYAAQGDFDTALAELDELLKDAPNTDEIHAVRSFVFEKQGKDREAKAAWEAARKINRSVKKVEG